MRSIVEVLVLPGLGAACKNAAGPQTCGGSTATYSSTAPNFLATVSQVTFESGWTPAGFYLRQYDLWLARPPATTPDAGLVLIESIPVFERAQDGTLTRTTACAINVGDILDVWYRGWALGAVQAPPGDTTYFATQVVIHR